MLYFFLSASCQSLADGIRGLRQRLRKHMGVDIFRRPGVAMAKMLGNHFRRYAHIYQERGIRVPLRYNNDKRKKPLFSRGLSVCRHLFNSFSKLKSDEKNIEKRDCFINDKI